MGPLLFCASAKNSDLVKAANAVIALELAILTFIVAYVPSVDKAEVDAIVHTKTTADQFNAMKRYVGDVSKTQKRVTVSAAIAVFLLAMGGLLVFPDPSPPKP